MSAPFIEQTATVYAAGGRRWFGKQAALKAYASAKWRKKHPCECEQPDYSSGYPGWTCEAHQIWDRVMPRYLAWIRRVGKRDGWL